MNKHGLDALVLNFHSSKRWSADSNFPQNPVTRKIRGSTVFDHMGQILPNVHRASNELCDTIAGFIVTQGLKRVLEIGTLFGYSTLHLAEAAKSIGGHVTTVDLRVPERKWQNGEIVKNIHLTAEKNIEDAGFKDVVSFKAGRSEQILTEFVLDGEKFDLIFIDGSHSRYVVTIDLLNSLNLLSFNGYIFLDDVSEAIAVKDFHHGGPNSIIPTLLASGRYHLLMLSSNTMLLRPK